eukprot:4118179-Amphidinium_carterae.2
MGSTANPTEVTSMTVESVTEPYYSVLTIGSQAAQLVDQNERTSSLIRGKKSKKTRTNFAWYMVLNVVCLFATPCARS